MTDATGFSGHSLSSLELTILGIFIAAVIYVSLMLEEKDIGFKKGRSQPVSLCSNKILLFVLTAQVLFYLFGNVPDQDSCFSGPNCLLVYPITNELLKAFRRKLSRGNDK
jgi:hypothetical protein